MSSQITLRLNSVGQVLISRNRRVGYSWRWGRVVVAAVMVATVGIMFTSLFWAWTDLHYITLNYQISQAEENKKQLLDLNRKLRIELSNLTTISRLEKLAAEYGMGPPQPSQVINLP
jgi:cell division protein FtsL